ncbi:MAG TPA: hypothetical protein VJQ83_10515, partial [Tepidiformaceae bacterium]|nr:hypothetical protein [Tepidiformaceae bacterium]
TTTGACGTGASVVGLGLADCTPVGTGNCVNAIGQANCDNQNPGCTGTDCNPGCTGSDCNPGCTGSDCNPAGGTNSGGGVTGGRTGIGDVSRGPGGDQGISSTGTDNHPGGSAILAAYPKAPAAGSGMAAARSHNSDWFILAATLLLLSGAAGLATVRARS